MRKAWVVSLLFVAVCAAAAGCSYGNGEQNLPEGSVREEDLFPQSGGEAVDVPDSEPAEGSVDYISSRYGWEDSPSYFNGHGEDEDATESGHGDGVSIPVNRTEQADGDTDDAASGTGELDITDGQEN